MKVISTVKVGLLAVAIAAVAAIITRDSNKIPEVKLPIPREGLGV